LKDFVLCWREIAPEVDRQIEDLARYCYNEPDAVLISSSAYNKLVLGLREVGVEFELDARLRGLRVIKHYDPELPDIVVVYTGLGKR
jgi:hypothetical protein